MKIRRLLFLVMASLAVFACNFSTQVDIVRGSGVMATEEREVQGVRGVTLGTFGNLTIALGEVETLTIEAEDNILPYLETNVRGGMLTIRDEPGTSLLPTEDVHYTLTVTNLDELSVTSSGNIEAPALQADSFKVSSSSSGDIHLAGLNAGRADVEISSSGDVMIDEGQIEQQEISISSSGAYKAEDVRCARATVDISSSGNADIWVTDSLDAELTSSGNVNYYGDAAVDQSASSSGRVVSLGER